MRNIRLHLLYFALFAYTAACYPQNRPQLVIERGEQMISASNVFFSQNNSYLALTSDQQIRIYDLKTGLFLKKISGENNYWDIGFSGDFKYFKFSRLKTMNEPDDKNTFEAVVETFTGKTIFSRPRITNGYGRYLAVLNDIILIVNRDSLQVIKQTGGRSDTTLYKSDEWTTTADQRYILLARETKMKYDIIDLHTGAKTSTIDFSKTSPDKMLPEEEKNAKEYGSAFFRSKTIFAANERYLLFTGELWSNNKVLKIFDREKDTVIFSKKYNKVDYPDDIFGRIINFSSATGIVTLPATNGIKIFNVYNNDSTFIPVKKGKTSADIYLSADGKYIIQKESDAIKITEAATGKSIFEQKSDFAGVLINPVLPLVYIRLSSFANPTVLVYHLDQKKIIATIQGRVEKISDNGRIVYGDIGNKYYLFNASLQPLREINNCTPLTTEIRETNAATQLVFRTDGACEYLNKDAGRGVDFQVWNMSNLSRIKNDISSMYFPLNDISNYYSSTDNFYMQSGPILWSLTDTAATKKLNDKYGLLRSMVGTYTVFLTNDFHLTDDKNDPGNTITILKNAGEVISSFAVGNSSIAAAGLDTVKKKLLLLSEITGKTGWYKLSCRTYSGAKAEEFQVYMQGYPAIDQYSIQRIDISPDYKYLHIICGQPYDFIHTQESLHFVFDLVTGRRIFTVNTAINEKLQLNFAGNNYALKDTNNFLRTGSLNPYRSKVTKTYPIAINDKYVLGFTAAGDYQNYKPYSMMFAPSGNSRLTLVNLQTNDTAYQEIFSGPFITNGAISNDNRWITYADRDNKVIIVDLKNNKKRYSLPGHTDYIRSLLFFDSSHKLITSSVDGTNKVWSVDSLKEIVTMVNLGNSDYIVTSPDGYYFATKGAQAKIGFSNGERVVAAKQLDLVYNRPDKVLRKINNTDTMLVHAYEQAWLKRMKKFKLHLSQGNGQFQPPELNIVNSDSLPPETDDSKLTLQITGKDPGVDLSSFNIWLNECPLFGSKGISLEWRQIKNFDTTITIPLAIGENQIEAALINQAGIESYRVPVKVMYRNHTKLTQRLHFVGIGIDQFADNKYNLQYSTKDIRDLSAKLKEKYKDNIIIDTLFNENVTISNVKALKQKLLQTTENDKVIVAYSGHGLLSKDYDYYLSTYSVNFEKPEQNGLPYDELESLLDSIPARKKLMLIDACHSGEVDKEDLITLNASSDSLIKGLKPVAYKQEGHLGLKNSFELMQSLFVNVGKSTGATIISAAAGTQFALERNDLKNGVFTYSILEAMNKYPTLTISELKKIVGERVQELTKGLQKPTSRNETIAVDWSVW